MISRDSIYRIVEEYDTKKIRIGSMGSHSALDICDGACEEGFHTFLVCQKGRERTYTNYFKSVRNSNGKLIKGVVDDFIILNKFNEMINENVLSEIRNRSVLFVPNRALTSYIDMDDVEALALPILGSRNMLRIEERGEEKNYYWLLEKAGIPFPENVNESEIDRLCIVKLPHAVKKLERGFFTVSSSKEYKEKSQELIQRGVITIEELNNARIERYIIGPVFNLNFFYSPINNEVELLGIDWRFETSLDGHVRLPAEQQMSLPQHQRIPEYTVCGHNSATLRESLIEKAYEMGEKLVHASGEFFPPGIIGPFCIQTCIDKDLKFYAYDVAPRIGGGTNIHISTGHPYANALWRVPMSSGRRLALEVKLAISQDKLSLLVT